MEVQDKKEKITPSLLEIYNETLKDNEHPSDALKRYGYIENPVE